jgi:hypothetical protein
LWALLLLIFTLRKVSNISGNYRGKRKEERGKGKEEERK